MREARACLKLHAGDSSMYVGLNRGRLYALVLWSCSPTIEEFLSSSKN